MESGAQPPFSVNKKTAECSCAQGQRPYHMGEHAVPQSYFNLSSTSDRTSPTRVRFPARFRIRARASGYLATTRVSGSRCAHQRIVRNLYSGAMDPWIVTAPPQRLKRNAYAYFAETKGNFKSMFDFCFRNEYQWLYCTTLRVMMHFRPR